MCRHTIYQYMMYYNSLKSIMKQLSVLQMRNVSSKFLSLSDFIAHDNDELLLDSFEIWGLLIILH